MIRKYNKTRITIVTILITLICSFLPFHFTEYDNFKNRNIIEPTTNFELIPSPFLIAGECTALNNTETGLNQTEIPDNCTENCTAHVKDGVTSLETDDNTGMGLNLTVNEYNNTVADNTSPSVYFHNLLQITNQSILNVSWSVQDENLTGVELYLNGNFVLRKPESGFYSTFLTLSEGLNIIELIAVDSEGNTNSSAVNVTLDTSPPRIESLSVIYPVGVISARPGDEAIIRVIANDSETGLSTVFIESCEYSISDEEMLENSDYFRLIHNTGDATHFAIIEVPDVPADFSCNVTAIDEAGNSAGVRVNVSVSQTLSAFNLRFMPGVNLISLPLIPENPDIESIFSDADFIESIWAYNAETSTWSVYTPGEAPDTLTELQTGYGYRVLANKSAFTTNTLPDSSEIPVPIKVSYNGSYLKPAQIPPTYRLHRGWNLIGFHSEREMVAEEYLAALTYPERIWTSLITHENYADFSKNVYVNRLSSLEQDDFMEPGCGYWIYVEQGGVVTP